MRMGTADTFRAGPPSASSSMCRYASVGRRANPSGIDGVRSYRSGGWPCPRRRLRGTPALSIYRMADDDSDTRARLARPRASRWVAADFARQVDLLAFGRSRRTSRRRQWYAISAALPFATGLGCGQLGSPEHSFQSTSAVGHRRSRLAIRHQVRPAGGVAGPAPQGTMETLSQPDALSVPSSPKH